MPRASYRDTLSRRGLVQLRPAAIVGVEVGVLFHDADDIRADGRVQPMPRGPTARSACRSPRCRRRRLMRDRELASTGRVCRGSWLRPRAAGRRATPAPRVLMTATSVTSASASRPVVCVSSTSTSSRSRRYAHRGSGGVWEFLIALVAQYRVRRITTLTAQPSFGWLHFPPPVPQRAVPHQRACRRKRGQKRQNRSQFRATR